MNTTTNAGDQQVIDDLSALFPANDVDTDADLHDLLAERADAAALLDVAYRTIDSPIGKLLLAATPEGLVRIAFELEDHCAVLARLADEISPRILRSPGRLDAAAAQLDEYFAGRRETFDVALDWSLVSGPFGRRVLAQTARIPFGATRSYREIAEQAGSPNGFRAAGNALGANPIPIIVPCHRVLASGGGLGGYTGGLDVKRWLLRREGRSAVD